MAKRKAKIKRETNETQINIEMNLDGAGSYQLDCGVGFLDHMLAHLSKHSKIDLSVKAKGDLEVDAHHTVEDVAICLGQCLEKALADKKGIGRYGRHGAGHNVFDLLSQSLVEFFLVSSRILKKDNAV